MQPGQLVTEVTSPCSSRRRARSESGRCDRGGWHRRSHQTFPARKGKGRSAAVVTAAIVTGAVVFPYTPPVGLIWALKKGDEAVLNEDSKSPALVGSQTEVLRRLPAPKRNHLSLSGTT